MGPRLRGGDACLRQRHFAPRNLQFAARPWKPPDDAPTVASRSRSPAPREANNMSFMQTLGPNLAVALMFFGVLLFSMATAVIALLADY